VNCGSCGEGPLASYGYLLLDPGVKACSDCIDKEKSDPRYRGAEVQELRDYADRMVSVHGCAPAQADAVRHAASEMEGTHNPDDCHLCNAERHEVPYCRKCGALDSGTCHCWHEDLGGNR